MHSHSVAKQDPLDLFVPEAWETTSNTWASPLTETLSPKPVTQLLPVSLAETDKAFLAVLPRQWCRKCLELTLERGRGKTQN